MEVAEIEKVKADAHEKALEMAKETLPGGKLKYGKVHEIFVTTDKEVVVGFMKEPPYLTKMTAMNLLLTDKMAAGQLILGVALIESESDKRMQRPLEEPDAETANIYISSCIAAIGFFEAYDVELKKN